MKPFLFVVWCSDLNANKDFYQSIGFTLEEQQHEGHDKHYSAQLGDMVFELHQSNDTMQASNNRLGFVVDNELPDYDQTLEAIAELASATYDMGNGQWYSVVSDPDGRSVELVYQK